MNYTWETLDEARWALDPEVTASLRLVAAVDLAPPVLITTGDCNGIDVVSLQFSRIEFCKEPTMLAAWLEGRAVGHRSVDGNMAGYYVMSAGVDLIVQLRNTSAERREVILELRPPEKVAQLGDDMEGVEIIAGEVCPKCGLPGHRSTSIPSAFSDWDGPIMVHKFTRVKRERDFEISSHAGCRLEGGT